jgi:TM2 domain-containing membrane protein YozV
VKKSTKAALLSAFVFPGVGHIYLKRYIPGLALVGASLVGIYYLISGTVTAAWEIAEKIQGASAQPDVTAIAELVTKQSAAVDSQLLLNIATVGIIICWIIGIVDSYRVGRERDANQKFQ